MSSTPFTLILGMHRSGTSCLAGCLEACGLFLGKVSCRGRYNAKGNREQREVWSLQDMILGLNKGSWHAPPAQVDVHPSLRTKLANLVHRMKGQRRHVGIKDPRTLLLVEPWQQITDGDVQFVGSFRHPLAVAASLAKRDGLSSERSLQLWIRYNSELVRLHEREQFPLIEYLDAGTEEWCRKTAIVAASLGLTPDLGAIRKFADQQLDHHDQQQSQIPESCQDIYTYLKTHAVRDYAVRGSNVAITLGVTSPEHSSCSESDHKKSQHAAAH